MKPTTAIGVLAGAALMAFSAVADAKTLRLSHNNPADHPLQLSMEFMAKRFKELTNGAYDIQIFPNAQLGNQRESMELVQSCSLEMAKTNASEMEAFAQDYSALNLPYLFNNEDHLFKVLSGELAQLPSAHIPTVFEATRTGRPVSTCR